MSASLALFAALGALLGAGAWIYNRLVADRNLAREGFADIDVQLKRRADLVPRLVEAVRGYAAYEKATLTGSIDLPEATSTMQLAGLPLVTATFKMTETKPVTGKVDFSEDENKPKKNDD